MANLTINGKSITVDVEDDTPLLWAIRENVGLTGTKYGCGIAQCGACTVHIDGVAMRSCGISVGEVMRSIWPFYGALLLALMLVTYVPAFSLWLPGIVLNK